MASLLIILGETFKIFCKNGKSMAFVAFLAFFINSILYFSNDFYVQRVATDIGKYLPSFNSSNKPPEHSYLPVAERRELGIFFSVESIYLLFNFFTFLLLTTSTILASSAAIFGGKDLPFKDLLLMTAKSWKKSLFIWTFKFIFVAGCYFLLTWTILIPVMPISQNPYALTAARIIIIIVASIFYVFVDAIWTLSLVISVVADIGGIEALGKAAEIVKRKKLQGFLLNFLFTISCYVLLPSLRLIPVITMNCIRLVWMLWFIAFSIFYRHCNEEEAIKMEGSSDEYMKILPTPLNGENKYVDV